MVTFERDIAVAHGQNGQRGRKGWLRRRARQERAMAGHAHGREANLAHLGMFHILLRCCPWRKSADRSVCAACDLRSDCDALAASDAELAHLAA
jgi:hypothetical protein